MPTSQPSLTTSPTPRTASCHLIFIHISSLSIYLALGVANAILLQGIATGSLAPQNIPYDKPAFLTWFNYNFLILGFVFPLTARLRQHDRRNNRSWFSVLEQYLKNEWAGRLGFQRAIAACAGIALVLTVINITFIIGLQCITIALSNAIYQLQTAFTVCFSVMMLGDSFSQSEMIGLVVSLCGVLLIVVPPLMVENEKEGEVDGGDSDNRWSSCSSTSSTIIGSMAIFISAVLWGFFQVAWRLFSESKELGFSGNTLPPMTSSSSLSRLSALVDTMTTLGVIGLCNLFIGCPLLYVFNWIGLEIFELPQNSHWSILICNALVEAAFTASCSIAIYMTSPVMISVIAPLMIPFSLVAEIMLYGASSEEYEGLSWWIGAVIIFLGVILMETKPKLNLKVLTRKRRSLKEEDAALLETEMIGNNRDNEQLV